MEGYVIDQWRDPEAIKIAQSDDGRMTRIREITAEMRQLQEQKNEALRMKLRGEVDAKTTPPCDGSPRRWTRIPRAVRLMCTISVMLGLVGVILVMTNLCTR